MTNILGVDYYRMVAETGDNEWAQVYVKTAFDKEELTRFGSVFGVIRLTGETDLVKKGMDLMERIDKWCSEIGHKGDVAGLLSLLTENLATGAFVWVYVDEGGARKVKVGALAGNSVGIRRNGNRVWLFESGDGRVVVGEMKDNDELFLGSKDAVDLIDEKFAGKKMDLGKLTDTVAEELAGKSEGARAALLLVAKPMSVVFSEESKEKTKDDIYHEEVAARIEKRQENETIVSDKVVGATGIAEKLAAAKLSWKDFSLKWQQARRLPQEETSQKKRRIFLLIGLVFLVVLGISVSLGIVKARKAAAEAAYSAIFDPLEKKREEAENLYTLNPVGAREMLRSVKQEEAAKKGQFANTSFEARIAEFEKAIQASWEKISGEQKAGLDLFFSLGLIRNGMKGDRMAYDGKQFLVLDSAAGVVATVTYPDKKQQVILGKGEGQNWLDVAGYAGNSVLLSKNSLKAVLSGATVDSKFDLAVIDPVAVDVFPGAAYVLDKGASEIWRYGLSGGAIGERRRWLLPGVEADFSGGIDIAIDTDIWVGMDGGKIMRFRRGQFEKFSLSDTPDQFKIKRLAVSNDNSVIAILDSDNGRIVLFNKDTGAFVKQLLADEFSSATDIAWVNDHELMVLVGDKMYLTSI